MLLKLRALISTTLVQPRLNTQIFLASKQALMMKFSEREEEVEAEEEVAAVDSEVAIDQEAATTEEEEERDSTSTKKLSPLYER